MSNLPCHGRVNIRRTRVAHLSCMLPKERLSSGLTMQPALGRWALWCEFSCLVSVLYFKISVIHEEFYVWSDKLYIKDLWWTFVLLCEGSVMKISLSKHRIPVLLSPHYKPWTLRICGTSQLAIFGTCHILLLWLNASMQLHWQGHLGTSCSPGFAS